MMIIFDVEDHQGREMPIAIPEGINLNLMEVLKASGLPVLATCGGIALCATCRVQVLAGNDQLSSAGDAEQDALDTLPFSEGTIRLSCQLPVNERMNNCRFRLISD
jgi:ferredoxin